jgi:aspartyl-tRNA(Asn)/glutamyl-tRNA(Gln) amidotransferase subunit C
MNITDIDKLAELARLEIPQEEKEQVLKDLTSIMGYIAQIGEVSVPTDLVPEYELQNVMRDDVVTTDSGSYTDALIDQMPDHEESYLKVKQIL